MKIKELPISEIIPYENNPRKNEKAVDIVAKSIKEFGFKQPIVIDKNKVIVAGHTRFLAAKKLGLEIVPVVLADDLTPEQVKAYRIMDNKSAEYSTWDEEKLAQEFEGLGDEIINTGFAEDEIAFILDKFDLDKEKIISSDIEDIEITKNKHKIKEGDIVVFENKHKIICGDSRSSKVFKILLKTNKIDLVVTSPPYNLGKDYGKYKDNKEFKEYLKDMEMVFRNIQEHMNKGRYLCINIGREWGPINLPAKYDLLMESLGYTFFRNIYWKKPLGAARGTITTRNPFPRYYIPKVQTEIIQIYAYDLENPEFLNLMITYKFSEEEKKKDERIPAALYEKYAGNVWNMAPETTLSDKHVAPYPMQLPYNCIVFFSKIGESVIDPFSGSGTTLIATDQLNRKFYGIEIDPTYVSLTIDRYKIYKPDAKIEIWKNGDDKKRRRV